jgi:hypothetical protein
MALLLALVFNKGTNIDMPIPSKSAVIKLDNRIRKILIPKCS